ncbi:MAG: DUF423 domain-containing protein [Bacteroidota bacterium]
MHSARLALISGAFLGLTGVILGAMAAHYLENILTPDKLSSFETAVRFQMYHAIALLVLGGLVLRFPDRWLAWSVRGILFGVLLFSGSIYLLTLTELPIGLVTPLGGMVLILGWAAVLLWAFNVNVNGASD